MYTPGDLTSQQLTSENMTGYSYPQKKIKEKKAKIKVYLKLANQCVKTWFVAETK